MKKHKLHLFLKAARRKSRLSLREIEQRSKYQITNGYISELENGNVWGVHPEKLRMLCGILKVNYLESLFAAGYITKNDLRK